MTSENMFSFTVRAAVSNDLPTLLALYQHLNKGDEIPDAASAEAALAQLSSMPGSELLVGFEGDTMVAACTLMILPNLTRGGRPFALIENVVTHAGYRHKGYARKVLACATEQAEYYGCYKIMLLTSGDTDICHFYERVGFEQTKTGFQIRLKKDKAL
ncbi:hypothetical protein LMG33818_000991 [Halomonadaceae bacterium LMG 33818]|uniref:GNAT family N-acetyltransferase n=1 Tax=Cernens ardua TaxID=3402176 RepID=UPI003EDBF681